MKLPRVKFSPENIYLKMWRTQPQRSSTLSIMKEKFEDMSSIRSFTLLQNLARVDF